ncbi:UDP-N-acetylmuramoyl-tripeptide--D-alanyl-D-alanine ligase [Sporosarcina sp. Sa2YVA2]|uniref:UDP-N-acetylmuramoyl-tripeptide--D-alanyl-D-alanine ligase n=1 Tax=Sporosarcina quadrami TaxID=2762234 RepID=A0ABR8UD03_9BACL|nr:UDP-N-acetylmuramoyl-tripeptide--D-alanyl-D-alanine ligase [Sporosarcina quadrami]MBD7985913.1 UDP-N-acetylmuramoyl-tripeptide--D-alanyl-D-alanine ligase [Sporosarcina quadrami]
MKPIVVSDIKELFKGKIISGHANWTVTEAIYYKRHDHTKQNTLLFVSRRDEVDWKSIDAKGPSLVITDKPLEELQAVLSNTTVMKVASLVQSYWTFINYYRNLFDIPVVTITGTCGKTTTKEMLKHMLSFDKNVQTSISSKNEPRRSFPYLVGIDEHTEAAVFEHGLGNSGNIKHQCMIYQPTIGIITNIGVHHLDGCLNLEGYIKAKEEIVEGIRSGGTLILNADDENTKKVRLNKFKGKIIFVGTGPKASLRASNIEFGNKGMNFVVHYEGKAFKAFVPGLGDHQVSNALAALAAMQEMGIDIEIAIRRLKTYREMKRHLEMSKGLKGSIIIDDTWTNNPTSVKAALQVVDSIGQEKKVILILGDINRLGNFEKKYHREIGSLVATKKVHTLITIGKKAEEIARQAAKDGSDATIKIFESANDIGNYVNEIVDENSLVLIKGPMSSRAMIALAESLKK